MSATPENSSIRPEALLCADWLRYVAAGGSAGVQDGQYKSLLLTAAEQLEAMHGALTVPVPDHFPGVRKMVEPAFQPSQDLAHGLEAAARWVDQRRSKYDAEHGHTDPDTGTFEYGTGPHAQAREEYSAELAEITEGIRGLKTTEKAPLGFEGLPLATSRLSIEERARWINVLDPMLRYAGRPGDWGRESKLGLLTQRLLQVRQELTQGEVKEGGAA